MVVTMVHKSLTSRRKDVHHIIIKGTFLGTLFGLVQSFPF
jgi:hypothetical protein